MRVIPGFLSRRIPDWEKVTAQCAAEIKIHLYALSLIIICMETLLLIKQDNYALSQDVFALSAFLFFFFFCVLDHVFKLFVRGSASSLFSLLPAVLLFLLLKNMNTSPYAGTAVIAAAAARAFFVFVPRSKKASVVNRRKILPTEVSFRIRNSVRGLKIVDRSHHINDVYRFPNHINNVIQ